MILHLARTWVQNDRDWSKAYHASNDAGRERVPADLFPANVEVNRVGVASWRAVIKEPTLLRRIADLAVPALIVTGSEEIRPDWPLRQLAHLLPNARFESIEGAEHHLELTRPDELRRLLRGFLDALPVDGRHQAKISVTVRAKPGSTSPPSSTPPSPSSATNSPRT